MANDLMSDKDKWAVKCSRESIKIKEENYSGSVIGNQRQIWFRGLSEFA